MVIENVTKINKDIELNIKNKELNINKILKKTDINIKIMVIENKRFIIYAK
jgi:hypothetical protein